MKACLAILLVAVAYAAASAPGHLPPKPPIHGDKYTLIMDVMTVDEGVSTRCGDYFDATTGNNLRNCSSTRGYHATYHGNGMMYVAYEINNKPVCYGMQGNPVTKPSYDDYEFVQTVYARNTIANHHRKSRFDYQYSIYTDVQTGAPIRYIGHSIASVNYEVISFVNNSVPEGIFTLPDACSQDKVILNGELPIGAWQSVHPFIDLRNLSPRNRGKAFQNDKNFYVSHKATLPKTVDNRVYTSPVRDQGYCGSCWTFGSAAATEVVVAKSKGATTNHSTTEWLAPQGIVDCTHGGTMGCLGGDGYLALGTVVQQGIDTEANYPYGAATGVNCALTANKQFPLSDRQRIPPLNVTAMMAAVDEHGALAIGTATPNSWVYYSGGVYDDPSCPLQMDHEVAIVGYGTSEEGVDYWWVKNSWGTKWGEAGFIRVRRGVNRCAMEESAVVPIAKN